MDIMILIIVELNSIRPILPGLPGIKKPGPLAESRGELKI